MSCTGGLDMLDSINKMTAELNELKQLFVQQYPDLADKLAENKARYDVTSFKQKVIDKLQQQKIKEEHARELYNTLSVVDNAKIFKRDFNICVQKTILNEIMKMETDNFVDELFKLLKKLISFLNNPMILQHNTFHEILIIQIDLLSFMLDENLLNTEYFKTWQAYKKKLPNMSLIIIGSWPQELSYTLENCISEELRIILVTEFQEIVDSIYDKVDNFELSLWARKLESIRNFDGTKFMEELFEMLIKLSGEHPSPTTYYLVGQQQMDALSYFLNIYLQETPFMQKWKEVQVKMKKSKEQYRCDYYPAINM